MPLRNINIKEYETGDLVFTVTLYDGGYAIPISDSKWLKVSPYEDGSWEFTTYAGSWLSEDREYLKHVKDIYSSDVEVVFSWLSGENRNNPTQSMIDQIREEIKLVGFYEICGDVLDMAGMNDCDNIDDSDDSYFGVEGNINGYLFYYHHSSDVAYLQIMSPVSGTILFESRLRFDEDDNDSILSLYDDYSLFNVFFIQLYELLEPSKTSWLFEAEVGKESSFLSWKKTEKIKIAVEAKTPDEAKDELNTILVEESYPPAICEKIASTEPISLSDENTIAEIEDFSELHQQFLAELRDLYLSSKAS